MQQIMTGAMCVVAQGSSAQLLIAVLVMVVYMLVILKTSPFVEDSEDISSFISIFTLTLTYIGGFALISEVNKRDANGEALAPTYKVDTLALLLVGMNVTCLVIELAIFLVIDVGGCVGAVILAQRQLQRSNALNETPMFVGLEPGQLSEIIRSMTLRSFPAGYDLVIQGDAAYEWMAIMKGTADVMVDGEIVTKFEKLSMLGEGALVADNKIHYRGATVRATSSVKALVLHRNEFLRLLKSGLLEHSSQEHAIEMSKTYKMNDIKRRNSSRNLLKVVPIQAMQSHQELARKTTDNLISIRKQFGAASPQYLRAAGRAQIAKMTAPAQIKKMMQMNGQQASTKQKELRKIRLQYGAGSPEYIEAAQSISTDTFTAQRQVEEADAAVEAASTAVQNKNNLVRKAESELAGKTKEGKDADEKLQQAKQEHEVMVQAHDSAQLTHENATKDAEAAKKLADEIRERDNTGDAKNNFFHIDQARDFEISK